MQQGKEIIGNLYHKDGKTPLQISSIVGLSQQAVSKILGIQSSGNTDTTSAGRPKKIDPKDYPAILRLLMGGEKQEVVSDKFGVKRFLRRFLRKNLRAIPAL